MADKSIVMYVSGTPSATNPVRREYSQKPSADPLYKLTLGIEAAPP